MVCVGNGPLKGTARRLGRTPPATVPLLERINREPPFKVAETCQDSEKQVGLTFLSRNTLLTSERFVGESEPRRYSLGCRLFKMKILCLHGNNMSGALLAIQTNTFRRLLGDHEHEYVFLDGEIESSCVIGKLPSDVAGPKT